MLIMPIKANYVDVVVNIKHIYLNKLSICISHPQPFAWPSALALAPGSKFVFTGPGPLFLFSSPGPQFVFTCPGPQFVSTSPDPQLVFTGPDRHFAFTSPSP